MSWQSFALNCVKNGISIKKAKELYKSKNDIDIDIKCVDDISKIHSLCLTLTSSNEIVPSTFNLSRHLIENADIFYSPCDEFEIYNVLNWILYPNWAHKSIDLRFTNVDNLESIVQLLIEHGLSTNKIDIPTNTNIDQEDFKVGDFIEYVDHCENIVAGKIIDISHQKEYLILPLGWSSYFSEWLPPSASIVPLTKHSKSFLGDTIFKRLQSWESLISEKDKDKEKRSYLNIINRSILSGQEANLKRRDMIKLVLLNDDGSFLISLIDHIIYPYLFK